MKEETLDYLKYKMVNKQGRNVCPLAMYRNQKAKKNNFESMSNFPHQKREIY